MGDSSSDGGGEGDEDDTVGLSMWSTEDDYSGGVLDAWLYTRAHLQAPGGTPTPTPREPGGTIESAHTPAAWESEVATELEVERRSLSRVEGIICAYPWPQGCEYWIGVAWCESTLGQNLSAYSSLTYTGLFQIWSCHGYGWEWLQDDANNTLAAWELSDGGKYTGAWPYCQWQ